ncbi:MAG: hypothetical protein ACOY82_07525 [Pseudomonadota bacterium]
MIDTAHSLRNFPAAILASFRDVSGVASCRREFAIVAMATALFLLLRGYGFGTDDHAIHLAFIERARDPGFLPGDPMLAMASKHPSLFFPLIAWLSHWASIESIYLTAYVLSAFAMLWALRALGRSLWPDAGAHWVSALALVAAMVPRAVAGGIDNFDGIFLPRVASMGPLLFALVLCVRGRPLWAFALTGAVFLFHATTAAHTATLIWMACLFCGRERLRALTLGPVIFLIVAGPLLIMMAKAGGGGIPTPAPQDWIDAVKLHYPRHHYESPFVLAMQASWGALAVTMGILCSSWVGAGRLLAGFLAGVFLLFAAGLIGNNLLYSPHTVQLHLFQAGRMLDALAVLSLGWTCYSCFNRSMAIGAVSLLPATAYVFATQLSYRSDLSGLPASLHFALANGLILALLLGGVLMTLALRVTHASAPGDAVGEASATPAPLGAGGAPPRARAAMTIGLLWVALSTAWASPTWDIDGSRLPGFRAMRWADRNLPTEATVVIPPYLTQPIVAFRYFGRRGVVGSWKDGGEGTFDHDFQMRWAGYIQDVYNLHGTVATADYDSLLGRVNRDYQSMSVDDFRAIARKYGATHVVREAGSPRLAFPELYRDKDYVIYRIPPD